MRRSDHLLKTMTVLRCCLAECLIDGNPALALEHWLRGLRQNPDWSDAEIAEVEAAARRAVAAAACRKNSAATASLAGVQF